MNLFFYDVEPEYVKYLKTTEIAVRGFTRVPDVEYQNEKKMVCGVILQINGFKYYVPVSSYKKITAPLERGILSANLYCNSILAENVKRKTSTFRLV